MIRCVDAEDHAFETLGRVLDLLHSSLMSTKDLKKMGSSLGV